MQQIGQRELRRATHIKELSKEVKKKETALLKKAGFTRL